MGPTLILHVILVACQRSWMGISPHNPMTVARLGKNLTKVAATKCPSLPYFSEVCPSQVDLKEKFHSNLGRFSLDDSGVPADSIGFIIGRKTA